MVAKNGAKERTKNPSLSRAASPVRGTGEQETCFPGGPGTPVSETGFLIGLVLAPRARLRIGKATAQEPSMQFRSPTWSRYFGSRLGVLLAPAVALMNRLRYPWKFVLISALFI